MFDTDETVTRAAPQRQTIARALLQCVDWTWDADITWRVLSVSAGAARATGFSRKTFVGRALWEAPWCLEPGRVKEELETCARERRPFRERHFTFAHPDGRQRVISMSGTPRVEASGELAGYAGFAVLLDQEDGAATDPQSLSAQLREAEATRRRLVHDFNNVLGIVLGFSQILVADLKPGTPESGYADRIATAARRGRELVEAARKTNR